MIQHDSRKRSRPRNDSALYMRDYNTSLKTKKLLARLSLILLVILFFSGFLLADFIGKELSIIMMVAPVVLMIIWFLVVWFYKGEPPPTLAPPIDIHAEFGKQYFQPAEVTEREEIYARMSRLPKGTDLDESIVKVID